MQSYLENNEFLGKDASYAEYFGASVVVSKEEDKETEINPTALQFSSVEGFVKEKDLLLSLTKELLEVINRCLTNPQKSEEQLQHARYISFGIIRSVSHVRKYSLGRKISRAA